MWTACRTRLTSAVDSGPPSQWAPSSRACSSAHHTSVCGGGVVPTSHEAFSPKGSRDGWGVGVAMWVLMYTTNTRWLTCSSFEISWNSSWNCSSELGHQSTGMEASKHGNGSTKAQEWKHQNMGMEAPKHGDGSIKKWGWKHQNMEMVQARRREGWQRMEGVEKEIANFQSTLTQSCPTEGNWGDGRVPRGCFAEVSRSATPCIWLGTHSAL